MTDQQTVVVTGFGPFGSHTINASWLAVQELARKGLGQGINLVVDQLPVAYSEVKNIVPKLWNLRPKLVVHVGVSGIADRLTLEQLAHNDGYEREDIFNCVPDTKCCVDGADHCLVSAIDMTKVQQCVNSSACGVEAIVSTDPGR
ncbi:pyroglutamyl-peptidase 1-like [Lingula anatina]|nr:pyroglutamyl-peptidase 1-like [Lingula anatina]|eukprot:XP_023932442.1 pyroglutamyl-peptidase 1-like [Lingula anatina]